MSKLFFKGRKDPRLDYSTYGYNTDSSAIAGSKKHPIKLTVTSHARQLEIEAQLKQQQIFATISLDERGEENIQALDMLLNKPATVSVAKTPSRNDPCTCGSGKKYKKCCAVTMQEADRE